MTLSKPNMFNLQVYPSRTHVQNVHQAHTAVEAVTHVRRVRQTHTQAQKAPSIVNRVPNLNTLVI